MGPGVKRKRVDEQHGNSGSTSIGRKVYAGVKDVRRSAKKAKTFEIQKLVKNLKGSTNPGKEPKASKDGMLTEVHLIFLKTVDHEIIGDQAFHSKILKDRILSSNEDIMAACSQCLRLEPSWVAQAGTGEAKVVARLLSSKILAMEVGTVVTRLGSLLQPNEAKPAVLDSSPKRGGKSNVGSPEEDQDEDMESDTQEDPLADVSDVEPEVDVGWESGSVNVDDAGWESGSLDEIGDQDIGDTQDSASSSESSASDSESEPGPSTKRSKPAETSKPAKAGVSTFLPSLSVGFTRGGDDGSDWSDAEANALDGAKRKNRRGQRARKAIWEKKYGSHANHIKKQREEIAADPKGYRARTGSASAQRVGHRPAHTTPVIARAGGGANHPPAMHGPPQGAARQAVKPAVDDRPLHPSWEAKRKLKEKEGGGGGIVRAQGKKIKFA